MAELATKVFIPNYPLGGRFLYNQCTNADLIYEDETYAIRVAIYEVYKSLGTGFLEEVYRGFS